MQLEELAGVLVEFAEDIHNDIGIWRSLEEYNVEFFETRLPLVIQPGMDVQPEGVNRYRICHLLWMLYPELAPGLVLSPSHRDLCLLAEKTSEFLTHQFVNIARDSGVKAFLSSPNKFGWDVKRKLIWLGQHSYLFRNTFNNYVENNGGKPEIPVIDDFVCEGTTCWSGLGVIDILAATLDISEKQRADLRSWYQRHVAYFKVLAIKGSVMEVMNVINDKPYFVRVGDLGQRFKVGQIVSGSLVPWDTEWYWSGTQSILGDVPVDVMQQLKKDVIQKVPTIAYRYCGELAQKAKVSLANQYREFVEYYGDDLEIYPDGLSMAASLQKQYRRQFESLPGEVISNLIKKHNLPGASPNMSVPTELLENEKGVGVYFNPDEGQEILPGFYAIIEGFKKKGVDLSEDEEDGIRRFVCSKNISPRFIKKLIHRYGDESIASAFLIDERHDRSYIDYLLRRYKGHFYRQRYPQLALL